MSLCKSAAASAASLLAVLALSLPAQAGVSEQEAARLGQDLTPIGAEKAGNADGTIPEWTGGLSKPPSNVSYSPGDHHPDPYADDAIKMTITGANADQHADKLTPGQLKLLKTYDTYKMNVYPTRRSCAFPEKVYEATKRNAVTGKLVADGNGVDGALLGFPFPIPQEGVEVVWNHNLRYRGFKLTRQFAALAPTTSAQFTPIVVQDQVIFTYTDPTKESIQELNNISLMYMQSVIEPARRAGEIILVHDTINQVQGPRKAWSYNPGQRRVRRAPTIAYDNPQSYSEGLQTADNFDLYNGAPDRYKWDLKGKKEKYIAYNSYKLSAKGIPYSDIAQPQHINQDLVRYELHRVWEVEGNLRDGHRHVYTRRVKYFDEDSWTMAAGELYDARGELWRIQEGHMIQYYDVPSCWNASDVTYDITAGRYVIQGLKNNEPMINFNADEITEDMFTPAAIRRLATR
ncbi:conserved protein [Tepidicaulis marinus]|uniref:Conserved protein n=1 Tax=Tepidicaulis marinus TaxID=1333998 RepID=A0A081B7M5_9HYPH|nr:DUF1329 domain-containing protein [Tepidicaulis marinus]GAK44043.1 conserved protein [Tepidicaulis marinus]